MNKRAQLRRHKKNNTSKNNINSDTCKNNTHDEKKTYDNPIDASIDNAYTIWNDIKNRVKTDEKFIDMKDNDKLEIYQNKYKDFYSAYPIVCRYMVCLGQYSAKAFKKYLLKCKNITYTIEERKNREFISDQWVRRQADYIRFLWEAYQKQHYNEKEARGIWTHAYKTLNKEFIDFKSQEKKIENQLNDDKLKNKKELMKELISRISNDDQKIDNKSIANLLEILKDQSYKQNKKKTLNQIKTDVVKIQSYKSTN
jgi:hypothetical protein